MIGMEPFFEATGPTEIVAEAQAKKLHRGFIIIRMKSYLLKEQLQLQSTGTSLCTFAYFYEVITNRYPNFFTSSFVSLVLNRWNSSHSQLMELLKIKRRFMEKVDSDNNWKTAWARMILGWHLFLRLSCKIC